MSAAETSKSYSGARLSFAAAGAPFTDGFVLTSQGFIFLLAQEAFRFSALELGLAATAYVLVVQSINTLSIK